MHPFRSVRLIQVFNNRNHRKRLSLRCPCPLNRGVRSIQGLFTVKCGGEKIGLALLSA